MRVVLAAADSASLKSVDFDRSVDTSNPESSQPQINTVLAGPGGAKKSSAITHICSFERFTVIARRNGQVLINREILHDFKEELAGLNRAVVSAGGGKQKQQTRRHALIASAKSGNSRIIVLENDGSVISTADFKLRTGLSSVVNDESSALTFASAGHDALPDVFKLKFLESKVEIEHLWGAEPLPNDRLDLPVPNAVTALVFLDRTRLAAVTATGTLRIYDTAADAQPVSSAQVSKYALKCVAAVPKHPGTVIIGDANTLISRWSTEPAKLLGTFKGIIGSTRALSVRGEYVAMGGLDRYLRVFHITKRQSAGKVYIGDEIWALDLLRTDDDEDASELDDMWANLSTKRRKVDDDIVSSDGESPFEGFDD